MKLSQMCALVFVVVLGSALAFGDAIQDPKVIVGGGSGSGLPDGSCPQCVGVGSSFSFTIPPSGSGTLFFTNESGKNWTSLKLIETGVPAADITCHSSLFESCKAETLKNGSVEILLSGVVGKGSLWRDHGIENGQNFSISFSCVKQSCWPGGLKVGAHGGTTPEPATLGLMLAGLGAVLTRRRRWLDRPTA